ncbi:MAG TPA: tetratricopeptide repeat protein, partial [Gemmatimonadaceae bacterium]
AHYLMGFLLGDMGQHEAAAQATKRAIQLNPSLSRAQANLSLDRYNPAKYEELLPHRQERRSQQMLEVAQEERLAHYNLGLAFRQKAYYAEALREYRLALERGEDRRLVLQAMAEVHLLKRDSAAAVELYDRIIAEQADSPKLWCERGVALHQAGKLADAASSYARAVQLDDSYAIAHNNLGVAHYHKGDSESAIDAFRTALSKQPAFVKAWLNLALILFKGKRLQLSLEAYRQVLSVFPEQPVAWNGIGLVLAELKKFEDARNAFGRAIQDRPAFAEAHYNLGFTLSNLGDFEGALRATKRALELDPFYVAQKFELAIDLEYEDPDLSIAPDLDGAHRAEGAVDTFSFDPRLLDTLFEELKRHTPVRMTIVAPDNPYAMASDYLAKGMLDRAASEINRALGRGADAASGLTMLGDVFTRQGLHGEALERYRQARSVNGTVPRAIAGETRALLVLGRTAEAREAAEHLLAVDPSEVESLLLVARARADGGETGAALDLLRQAQRLAPARADVLKQIGDIARAAGDLDGAIIAYRNALDLDHDFAVVHYDLALLLAQRGDAAGADAELLAALDAVPTYVEATLALADVRRRFGRAKDAIVPLVDLLQRDPYNFDALLALAETLLELERGDDAERAVDRVLRFDPRQPGALLLRGMILADRHRYREAIALWNAVVEVAPESPYARRAQREAKTAADLLRIFRSRQEVV